MAKSMRGKMAQGKPTSMRNRDVSSSDKITNGNYKSAGPVAKPVGPKPEPKLGKKGSFNGSW